MSDSAKTSPDKLWWTASMANRGVAAFHAGRLLNQLRWHMSLAALFNSHRTDNMVREVLSSLATASYELIDRPPNDLELTVKAVQDRWHDELNCEALADALYVADIDHDSSIDGETRKGILAGIDRDFVRPLTDPLHWAFKSALRNREVWAFELGECLDQGVHHPDVYRFVYQPPKISDDFIDALDDYVVGAQRGSVQESDRDSVVNHHPHPGELLPPDGWSQKLVKLCEKAGIGGTLTPEMFEPDRGKARDEARAALSDAIVRADQIVRKALGQLRFSVSVHSESTPSPHSSEPVVTSCDKIRHENAMLASGSDKLSEIERIIPAEYARLQKIKARAERTARKEYIGESVAILRVFESIDRLNRDPSKPVLILGPSGSGKSEIAEIIHNLSERSERPFRVFHATDARGDHGVVRTVWLGLGKEPAVAGGTPRGQEGLLKTAHGGTIFVEEVADLDEWFQVFLLRILDRQAVDHVAGESEPFIPDVRLILATDQDLEQRVDDGRFRPQLYRRIRHGAVKIPPLNDRIDDVPLFLAARIGKRKHKVTARFLLALVRHNWEKGNVGELINTIDWAIQGTSQDDQPLDLGLLKDFPIDPEVAAMSKEDAEIEIYIKFCNILEPQGFKRGGRGGKQSGEPLHKRIAQIMRISAAKVSDISMHARAKYPERFASE